MSLILTQINKHGIVFAADSNITVNGTRIEKGEKIFKIPHLKAALCLAGAYSVNGEDMDNWMKNYIKKDKSKSLKKFAEKLSTYLEKEMKDREKSDGCIIHISGFVKENGSEHPEMWGIGNVDLSLNGGYTPRGNGFQCREDFWNRDWETNNLRQKFITPNNFGYQYYINGFTAGRVSFNLLTLYLNNFLSSIWQNQQYKFRPPRSIKEYESLAKFTMGYIALMFTLSEYLPKYIGGKISSLIIEAEDKEWFTQ